MLSYGESSAVGQNISSPDATAAGSSADEDKLQTEALSMAGKGATHLERLNLKQTHDQR